MKGDSAFACKDDLRDSLMYEVGLICNSTNELEIRLSTFAMPHGGASLFIITFNKGKWGLQKYLYNWSSMAKKMTAIKYMLTDDRVVEYNFKTQFNLLKEEGVFLLPNQSELNLKGFTHDGVSFGLTFKVGNVFRRYGFSNPDNYVDNNPHVKELKQMSSIVKIITGLFEM